MVDDELQKAVASALGKAQKSGELPRFDVPQDIPIERPRQESDGDFATPICLQLARYAKMPPVKIADAVVKRLPTLPFIGAVEVAHPGFVNFQLSDAWLTSQVETILAAPDSYGSVDLGHGAKVQVEFVSANPTGPLHIGSARNAVFGDTLASLLDAAGYNVQREYYVNDSGARVRAFAETLHARYAQALGQDESVPEDGYHGPYTVELGSRIAKKHGRAFLDIPRDEALNQIGALGVASVVQEAEADLAFMGVRFDKWFSEQSLYDNGQYEWVMTMLREGGHLYLRDGAVWLSAEKLGADKDEVVVRSNGTPGYFASDIAYHREKFVERGFERVIDVWGADHQGHVPRMKAMMRALGLDPDRLTIVIQQMVTLKRGGEVVRLSKRTGDIITLREVLEEVGSDATRYFLLSRSADSQMDFDLDLAKEQSEENPVYYVQYAHARICSILRHAGDLRNSDGDVRLLTSPPELSLIRKMVRLPEVVRTAAAQLTPHNLTYYAQDLAAAFHAFYRDCRVVDSDPAQEAVTRARLRLVVACRSVLARVLNLMGMTAPEVM